MATHDYVIANASGAAVRSDLNGALAAIVSNNSATTPGPTTTYGYQWWADETAGLMKIRNSTNDGWVSLFNLDGSSLGPGKVTFGATEVVFNDAGNNVDFRIEGDTNANLFFVDASADAVGIGTTSPQNQLHLVGSSTANYIRLDNSSGARTYVGTESGGSIIYAQNSAGGETPLTFAVGSTPRATIDSSGRLLVGTSSARTNIKEGTDNETPKIQFETAVNDYSGAGLSIINNSGSGYAPQIWLGTSSTNAISGNGLVGSGRIGAISFNGADGTNFVQGARISAEIDGTTGSGSLPTKLVFSTTSGGSPTERMRIANTGLIRAFSSEGVFRVNSSQGAGTTYELFWGGYGGSSTTSEGTNSIKIYTNGNIQNTNNSYGALSDIKLKENIVDATSQWSDIKALQVRKYNFKENQTHTQIGLIAQEVELVSPGLVTESPDRDEDGNDLGTVTKSVNYSVLYMKAVKALQEAMERIETLEASNTDLLARVSALESA